MHANGMLVGNVFELRGWQHTFGGDYFASQRQLTPVLQDPSHSPSIRAIPAHYDSTPLDTPHVTDVSLTPFRCLPFASLKMSNLISSPPGMTDRMKDACMRW